MALKVDLNSQTQTHPRVTWAPRSSRSHILYRFCAGLLTGLARQDIDVEPLHAVAVLQLSRKHEHVQLGTAVGDHARVLEAAATAGEQQPTKDSEVLSVA